MSDNNRDAALRDEHGFGPKVTVKRDCFDCKACTSERYVCQSDSGHDVYCEHPSLDAKRRIGDSTWSTPAWCPALTPPADSGCVMVPRGWQPIETAPKEPRDVLVANKAGGVELWDTRVIADTHDSIGWLTHWRELPAAPAAPKEQP